MMNKCRLAAVSNYKLAQLTFSSVDHQSLKKTALIKNLLVQLYENNDYNMTRWEFFTPESLENTTQRDIEKIIQRYTQVICSQSPIEISDRTTSYFYPDHYLESTGTTTTYAKNLAAELINLFDMEFCLDLSLPTYRQSNSFDEPRYPVYNLQAEPITPPKRVSSLEYRRSKSEPSLIDDDDIKSVSTNSIDTIELELEVSSRSSVLSGFFSSFISTSPSSVKRQKSIKRFFSFSSKQQEEIIEKDPFIVQNQKLTRSKSVGNKLLKRIKSLKYVNPKA